jgi:two-component system response regulator RegX3
MMERAETRPAGPAILVVEDEQAILRGLCDVLAFQGYSPEGVARGDLGYETALDPTRDFALILLDVMLPGMNGFEICEQLRAVKPDLPILMLTARGSEEDILHGFRCGADDYVTKPFSVAQLLARVAALLRRPGVPSEQAAVREPFVFGDWSIDPEERLATKPGQQVELTVLDLDVLSFFARERGRISSRRRLLTEVWGYPDSDRVETRSVDMQIAKLRKKLGVTEGGLIETIRGEGYRFRG